MAKQRCTISVLTKLVEDGIDPAAHVTIHRDPDLGWRPIVHAAASDRTRIQMQADAVADELRTQYELA
jgi:hypothetical protein